MSGFLFCQEKILDFYTEDFFFGLVDLLYIKGVILSNNLINPYIIVQKEVLSTKKFTSEDVNLDYDLCYL